MLARRKLYLVSVFRYLFLANCITLFRGISCAKSALNKRHLQNGLIMERVKTIRRQNFESLLREFKQNARSHHRKGTLKEFAAQHGLDRSHASQMKTGIREIGEEIARRLEAKHSPRLPHGWLDEIHTEHDPKGAREEAFQKLAIMLYRLDPKSALTALNEIKTQQGKK